MTRNEIRLVLVSVLLGLFLAVVVVFATTDGDVARQPAQQTVEKREKPSWAQVPLTPETRATLNRLSSP